MQCAWAILSYVACPALQYFFFHFSNKRQDFRKKKSYWTENVFWFSLQLLSERFFVLRRFKRDMIKNVYWSSCKVSIILVRFYWNLNFLKHIFENFQISNFMKICPVRAKFSHADGRMDRHDETNSRFSEFCKGNFLPVKIWKMWRSNLQRENLDIFKNQILYS